MGERMVEFVGGIKDGYRRAIPDGRETCTICENKAATAVDTPQIVEHHYRLRRVNGIAVRLPSGLYAMDYQGETKADG